MTDKESDIIAELRARLDQARAEVERLTAERPKITINTLHPGDHRTLEAIGRAAVAHTALKSGIQSPTPAQQQIREALRTLAMPWWKRLRNGR